MNRVLYRDLGRMDYPGALGVQHAYFDPLVAAKAGRAACRPASGLVSESGVQGLRNCENRRPETSPEMCLLVCEHPHVYTLGRSGHESNLLVDASFLKGIGAACHRTDRGGDVTYHGPGQIVLYPILDLERLGMGLREYIHALEEAVIRTLADYGLAAGRSEGATGVWLGAGTIFGSRNGGQASPAHDERWAQAPPMRAAEGPARKICAIGVRSSRFVTMHGAALNVNTDLAWFGHINPCGFTDRGVTSLARELGAPADTGAVKSALVSHMEEIMNIKTYNYADRKKMGTQAPG